ncbi:MAG: glycosyltransferase family 9 protein [Desulfovibrio sp.]
MPEFRKIGVWQTAFLGDAVLTLPLLRALNLAYPKAELHFFVRGGLEGLFAAQQGLASVTGFYKRGGQKSLAAAWRLGREISNQDFDLWISPHASLRSAVVALATGAPMRIGYRAPLYNRVAYTHTVNRCFRRFEEIERLLRLLRPLDLEPAQGDFPWPELTLPPDAHSRAAELLQGLRRPLLGLHPGSTWPTKQWPVEYFAEVASHAARAGAGVAVFAGPGEEADATRVVELADAPQGSVVNLAGQPNLPALAACIRRVDAYLTNDSGPMHLAWMQHVPTLALFGPTVRDLGFFPRGETAEVLEMTGMTCRPCGLHGPRRCPRGHHECMRLLKPEQVWEHLAPMLGFKAQPAS